MTHLNPITFEYITAKKAAALLGKTEKALELRRRRKDGPMFYKFGRSVYYKASDLIALMQPGMTSGGGMQITK